LLLVASLLLCSLLVLEAMELPLFTESFKLLGRLLVLEALALGSVAKMTEKTVLTKVKTLHVV
jgi:hypothetical protein